MNLVRQQHCAWVRPGPGPGHAGLRADLQPQLGVRVALGVPGQGRRVAPQPVQHLLRGEGRGREREDPVKLLLQLLALSLRGLEVGHQIVDVDVTSQLSLLQKYLGWDQKYLGWGIKHDILISAPAFACTSKLVHLLQSGIFPRIRLSRS